MLNLSMAGLADNLHRLWRLRRFEQRLADLRVA